MGIKKKIVSIMIARNGVGALAEKISEAGEGRVFPWELLRDLATVTPGIPERSLFSLEEVLFFRENAFPFWEIDDKRERGSVGVFFLYLSSKGKIVNVLSAKGSALDADCPLAGFSIRGFQEGDIIITKTTFS